MASNAVYSDRWPSDGMGYFLIFARRQPPHKRNVRLGEWNRNFSTRFVLSALAADHSP